MPQYLWQINETLKIQNQLFSLTSSQRCFFDISLWDASLDVLDWKFSSDVQRFVYMAHAGIVALFITLYTIYAMIDIISGEGG